MRQPGMPMTGGLGPFSVDAKRGTIADLLYPRVASDVIKTFFQDQDLHFKTKTLKFFQDQDQDFAPQDQDLFCDVY